MEKKKVILKSIRFMDNLVDLLILVSVLLFAFFGIYSLWDTEQIYSQAMADVYGVYKPTGKSEGFEELKEMNPDVIGWIHMYGTGIDYPLLQGQDNDKYVQTDPKGNYSMTGSLFLDYRNSLQFNDFNSIIYGHDMAKEAMFGGLNKYAKKKYFNKHLYGSLYYGEKTYGLEVFSYFSTDAYDQQIYAPAIEDTVLKNSYLNRIKDISQCYRDISINENDHIILFSTCTSDMTNGRNLLVLKITDKARKNTLDKESHKKTTASDFKGNRKYIAHISIYNWIILIISFIFILYVVLIKRKKKGRKC